MPTHGNKDIVTFASKYDITTGGVITRQTGTDSFFTKATLAGDSINYAGQEYVIKSVDSATQVTVRLAEFGGTITGATGATVFVQQKPKHVKFITDPSSITGRKDVYGVSTGATGTFSPTEQQVSRTYNNHPQHAGWVRNINGYGGIDSVAITNSGSGYRGVAPTVSFSTTRGATGVLAASGTAVLSNNNSVSSVTFSSNGLYTTSPADWVGGATGLVNPVSVSFTAPANLVYNNSTNVNTTSKTITFSTPTFLQNGDPVVYGGASGATGVTGLTVGTTYFVRSTGATGIQLFTTAIGAQTGATAALVAITSDGAPGFGVFLQGVTATGSPLMGGRFGRQLNETLVAFKNITNDAADDAAFPDT